MGFPISKVGYTSATTGRGDHEVHKGHVAALGWGKVEKKSDNSKSLSGHAFLLLLTVISMTRDDVPRFCLVFRY
jgi:hypothetical protein